MRVLVIGTLTIDYFNDQPVPGGPVYYSIIPLIFLGVEAKVLAVVGKDFFWSLDFDIDEVTIDKTTVFKHVYVGDSRESFVLKYGNIVELNLKNYLDRFDILIVNFTLNEIELDSFIKDLKNFRGLKGIDVQGLIRKRKIGKIEYIEKLDSLRKRFLNMFDVVSYAHYEPISDLKNPIVIEKRGSEGAIIRSGNEAYIIPTYRVRGDPTGAGDVFLTTFLIKLYETNDVKSSGCLAASLASLLVDGSIRPRISGKFVNIRREIIEKRNIVYDEFIKRSKIICNSSRVINIW